MPKVTEENQAFIRSMQRKYRGFLQPSGQPAPQSMLSNTMKPRLSNGFTGRGPDNRAQDAEPAGVYHENEHVTPAPLVRAAGGPSAVQNAVEMKAAGNINQPAKPLPSDQKLGQEPLLPRGNFGTKMQGKGAQFGTPTVTDAGVSAFEKMFGIKKPAEPIKPDDPVTIQQSSTITTPEQTITPASKQTAQTSVIDTQQPVITPDAPETAESHEFVDNTASELAKQLYTQVMPAGYSINDESVTEGGVTTTRTVMRNEFGEEVDPKTFQAIGYEGEPIVPEEGEKVQTSIEYSEDYDPDKPKPPPGEFDFEPFVPANLRQMPQTERSKMFEKLLDDQIAELQLIAKGEGTASKVASEIAMQKLSGQLAAGNMAAAQAAAQIGLTGGSLAANIATRKRDAELAKTGLQGQLALAAVERAETAVLQLASLAESGTQFEEMKRQYGDQFNLAVANYGLDVAQFNEMKEQFSKNLRLDWENIRLEYDKVQKMDEQFWATFDEGIRRWDSEFGLALDQFREDVRRFDLNYAMENLINNHGMKMAEIETLLLTENYEAAGQIWSDHFGINVDYSNMIDSRQQGIFGDSIANMDADFNLVSPDFEFATLGANGIWSLNDDALNTDVVSDGIRAWNAMHPDQQVTKDNVQGTDAEKWIVNTINARRAMQSEAWASTSGMSETELWGMVSGITNEDGSTKYPTLDSFTYAGKNGSEAVRLALANLQTTGGLYVNDSGDIDVDVENPLWELFNLTTPTQPTPEMIEGEEDPLTRLEMLGDNLVNVGETPGENQITLSNFTSTDLMNVHDNPDVLGQLRDAGYLDANARVLSDIPTPDMGHEVEAWLRDQGIVPVSTDTTTLNRTLNLGSNRDAHIRSYRDVNDPDSRGPIILIGDKRYELDYIHDFEYIYNAPLGINNWHRAGHMLGWEVDADGNRIGEETVFHTGDHNV